MTQTTDPVTAPTLTPPSPEAIQSGLEELKGLSLGDFIQRMAEGIVDLTIHIAVAILVFYIGRFIIKRIHRLVARVMVRREVDLSLSTFILSMVKIVLYFILIITVVGILGINTSSFLALFASAGVAIGMALSGTLQNFAGGVLILLLKPYRIGDYIEAQGYAGTVKEIQIFHTIINTYDNKSIIIPNGGLSTGTINNWNRAATRRVSWDVSLAYGDDVEKARTFILEMLHGDERVIKGHHSTYDPAAPNKSLLSHDDSPDLSPTVVLSEMADSAIKLSVRAWTATPNYWALFYEINERLYRELPLAGFHFPFPQLDIHLSHD
ncbi:MAG: mechanosensitive ion channel [Pseudoflavonifractor sp.]|nr:mechanosensitive ion channel [Alloprevotella sp.]MCM1116935.1 mechanosensitive ion channel [Pseudoflavonifractor sp.]